MAELNKNATVTVNFIDNTKAGIASLSAGMEKVDKSSGSLAGGLKTLGMVGVGLWAGRELLNFFQEAGKLAYDDEKAAYQLEAAISSLGTTIASQASPKIKQFEEYMVSIGQHTSDTDQSLRKFIMATGDVDKAITLSKQASDLAASGYGDLESNTQALVSVVNGRARPAIQAFGLEWKAGMTPIEAYRLILGKVTTDLDTYSKTQIGVIDTNKTKIDEFMGYVGKVTLAVGGFLAGGVNRIIDGVRSTFEGNIGFLEPFDKMLGKEKEITATSKDAVKAITDTGEKSILELLKGKQDADDAAAAQQSLADALKASFRDVSKAIVSAVNDQEKAIDDLRKAEKSLNDQLTTDIDKANEKYKSDVTSAARNAKSKIDDIDKQIADEQRSQNEGWRTKIAELQIQKAKEQAIIDKAGGVVTDLSQKVSEDEFDILAEAHKKEVADLQATADKKKKLMDEEITARTAKVTELDTLVGSKDFYSKASKEGTTFAGAIGQGGIQQIIQFTFNGDVSDIETLKKQVVETLNRTASLRQIGAK